MTYKRLLKKFLGLNDRLIDLLDESSNIFFEERPFLEDRSKPLEILDLKERREENELSIKEVKNELLRTLKAMEQTVPKKTQVIEQKSLLSVD